MELKSIQEASLLLKKANHALSEAAVDLTAGQAATLLFVAEAEEIPTLGDVARHLDVTPAVITGMVDRLEKRGAIERVAGTGDRRRTNIRITDRGIDLLEEADKALQAVA